MPKLPTIVGHAEQRQQLLHDLSQGNVDHAYLFSGPRHLGKFSLALRFAFDLLSVGVPEEERKKLQISFEKLLHPDLLVLDRLWVEDVCDDWDILARFSNVPQRQRAKNPPAKTDTIGIDDIRALQERLHETGSGTYRCCIIRSVERMQDPACSAFLKILEEPPEGLVFLLTTQTQGALLPTLVSRTRVVPLQRVAQKDLRTMLAGVPDDEQAFILHIAEGAPGTIADLRDDPDLLRMHRTVHGTAQSFWRSTTLRERLQILAPLSTRGQSADNLLLHLGLTLREQQPAHVARCADAYQELMQSLRTNAHRQLLAQRFALKVS